MIQTKPTTPNTDIHVKEPTDLPTDSVSNISWASKSVIPTFATSDWASFVRIYQLDPQTKKLTQSSYFENESPCLSVRWNEDETKLFTGCANGAVNMFDLPSGGKCQEIGRHDGPVKSVHWMSEANALVTLSFDKTIRFWDLRQEQPVAGFALAHKIYCSDMLYPYLAIGLSEAKLITVDLPNVQRQLEGEIQYTKSPLGEQCQLTAIKLFKDGESLGVGIGSNDGRCCISMYRDRVHTSSLANVITFKAQKLGEGANMRLFPVNSFGIHPSHPNRFVYTVGGEGMMYYWDILRKDKIAEFDFKGIPVTQAEIDPTGTYMAYSLGYDWARGIEGYMSQPSKVCVHVFQADELDYNGINSTIRYH